MAPPSEAPDDSFSSACPLTKTFNPPMRIWSGGKAFGIGLVQGIGTRDRTIIEGLAMAIPAMRADASPASGLGRAVSYAGVSSRKRQSFTLKQMLAIRPAAIAWLRRNNWDGAARRKTQNPSAGGARFPAKALAFNTARSGCCRQRRPNRAKSAQLDPSALPVAQAPAPRLRPGPAVPLARSSAGGSEECRHGCATWFPARSRPEARPR